MYAVETVQITKQRADQARRHAERDARHIEAARRACKPAAGLLGKVGMCRKASA